MADQTSLTMLPIKAWRAIRTTPSICQTLPIGGCTKSRALGFRLMASRVASGRHNRGRGMRRPAARRRTAAASGRALVRARAAPIRINKVIRITCTARSRWAARILTMAAAAWELARSLMVPTRSTSAKATSGRSVSASVRLLRSAARAAHLPAAAIIGPACKFIPHLAINSTSSIRRGAFRSQNQSGQPSNKNYWQRTRSIQKV